MGGRPPPDQGQIGRVCDTPPWEWERDPVSGRAVALRSPAGARWYEIPIVPPGGGRGPPQLPRLAEPHGDEHPGFGRPRRQVRDPDRALQAAWRADMCKWT